MTALIDEVMTGLGTEDPDSPWIVAGEVAQLSLVPARRPDPHAPPWPDNYLTVAVNAGTGYGGLTWFVTARRTAAVAAAIADYVWVTAAIADYVWVTDNPSPPAFDPRVVSDPCYPAFYHPRSAVPAARIRVALEEFCRTGTGARPESVAWVRGEPGGRRLDAEPNVGIKRDRDGASAGPSGP
jgi:hypothetical protein